MLDNISVNNYIIPVNTNQPLDIRTLVNSYSDISLIPNPYIGMTITVKVDETNDNKMTDYKVKSLKSNELGMNNTVIDEIERLDEYVGIDEVKTTLDTIVYLLPSSNGVDDTGTIQSAINTYKKIQLNGSYIVSNLTIDGDIELIGKNKRSDKLKQKTGSTGNIITANGYLSLKNITIEGNNEDSCSGVVYARKVGQVYSGTGDIENCEITKFKEYGLKLDGNRNMLRAYEIGITYCGVGLYIESSDNLLSKLDVGDCDTNIKVYKGGGNVFESCCLYRSNECCIWLGHEAYYATFSNTSIDTNKKQSVYIKQVDTNVADRGHKFVGCTFFGNSSSNSAAYNCFEIDGAKGVIIQACNFFVYDDVKVKYLVNITNGGFVIMQGNSYNTDDKEPYSSGIVNDKEKCSLLDYNNSIFNSNISIQSGKKISFFTSNTHTQILQSFVSGESYARLQMYSDGRIIFGNGQTSASIRLEVSNADTLKLANSNLLIGKGLGVGNSTAATTVNNVVKKIEIFNENGSSLGYIPIYDRID